MNPRKASRTASVRRRRQSAIRIESLEGRQLLAADFTIAALSDTQYTVESFPQTFRAQTQWIADHATDPNYNIAFMAHQGDMLRRGYSTAQAATADGALKTLDGRVPYTVDIGNHDYDNQFDDLDHHVSSANFTSWFGDARYKAIPNSGFGGSSLDQRNRFHTFSAGGREFLVLSLEWEAPDASIAWAQGVINAHRQLPVILTTHEYLRSAGRSTSPLDPAGNAGEAIFQKLVKPNPQIFLVLGGHTGAVYHQTSSNGSANPDLAAVHELAVDFESRPNGGDGYFQLLHFVPERNAIDVTSYSPTLNRFDAGSANLQFSLPLDFGKRFAFSTSPIPVSNDDAYAVAPGGAVAIDVRENDFDADGAASAESAILGRLPLHGTLTPLPDGTFDYVPDAGFSGDDSFTYALSDGTNTGNLAGVTLRVNTAPTGADDVVATPEGKPVTVNVVANDADADANALRPILTTLPAHGAVFANADGTFTYTPDPKYTGPDSFAYVASDGNATGGVDDGSGGWRAVTVSVDVTVPTKRPAYDYPVAESTPYGTRGGTLSALAASDGVEETIREVLRVGSSDLEQRWQFNVTGGSAVTFCVNARRTWGADEFHFQYSTNGGTTWADLQQIVPASSRDVTRVGYDADEPYQMWNLPAATRGTVWIRATDTVGNDAGLETLAVDEMFIRSVDPLPPAPPAAPSSLTASYSRSTTTAALSWVDNSNNETGFRVWYSTDAGRTWNAYAPLAAGVRSFTTPKLTKGLTYQFRVTSFNGNGESSASNTVSVSAK